MTSKRQLGRTTEAKFVLIRTEGVIGLARRRGNSGELEAGQLALNAAFISHKPHDSFPTLSMALLRMPFCAILLYSFFCTALAGLSLPHLARDEADYRYIPGDPGWPGASAWNALNATVSGRLIATTPLAAPCHDPHYNATACALLRAQWAYPRIQ
jgi:hypothetical protein